MSARSCDQLCPITADHISRGELNLSVLISATSMPHISAHLSCLSMSPISATYQCQSVPPVSAIYLCHVSVLPFSAHQ
ncbi:unnamed protein product [Staurois parvus]|uniref:Uncharacterized protein n=1 Tax=Staurois parvus TaxID=386267 RepID=A0ABN9FPB6_9NEOB|nr:unnamed protein product [Staurois parvus]